MLVSATRLAVLNPADRAIFATTARLLSCLVTESLLRAVYLPIHGFEATGFSVVFSHEVSSKPPCDHRHESKDILAIIPLHSVPIFKHDCSDMRMNEIGLLDPLDMMPLVFEIDADGTEGRNVKHIDLTKSILKALSGPGWAVSQSTLLYLSESPTSIWKKYGTSLKLKCELLEEITSELESSVKWQQYSYEHPPTAPFFSSSSIDWEQSIVEGHPIHPMHKARIFLPPLPDTAPGSCDLYHPKLRLVSIPKEKAKITYDFEELIQPIVDAASRNANRKLPICEGHVVLPVHELQLAHIQDKVAEAEIYPEEFSLPLLAQQSIRSLLVPGAYREHSLKLGLGIKLTSAVRTISPESAYLGPRFSRHVVPYLSMNPQVVTVAKELGSIIYAHPEGEIAKHCAAIVREAHENTSEDRGERLIVCTALVESGHSGEDGHLPAVIRVFGLDTEEKRVQWLDKFIHVFFEAFLPSMLHNGVAFECHPQNCVARFDIQTKELRGFIIRDFGGLRIQQEKLKASTGVELDCIANHSIIAKDLQDVYTRMYHTIFHNHFQQLIRVLGLHYNGLGWEVVRNHLKDFIPTDHDLYQAWLSPERTTITSKCFLRMRMLGMYRLHLHSPVPNLIHYRGVGHQWADSYRVPFKVQ